MQYHHRKKNLLCFDCVDLKVLFEAPHRKQILKKILESEYSFGDLIKDKAKVIEIAASVPMVGGKESVEIFMTLYSLLDFYPNAKICFPLKDGIDPKKPPIDSLEKLIASIKENGLTDVGLMCNDGLRDFQLKSYRGEINSDVFASFIKNKLLHYGNDLGEVNLLITLKTGGEIPENFLKRYIKH